MSDILAQLQSALGNAFVLERELGGGGMARVFVATERSLGRRVVVKVLTPELAQGLSAERFAREIRLAAALQDPHIVPVLVAGDAGGLPYFTMPYVEGESLRARLLRGEMPFAEAVGVLRDVALALEYAHARGIIHRDIKPENVLLSGRTAVVADFGIAKAVSAARTYAPGSPTGTLTSIGQSLGTPAYMAPEQVAGDPVDHRADLYAWGIMAYELLAGRHPFAAKTTAAQLMAAHVAEKPLPLVDATPGLPVTVAALVMQALEKDPVARPQGAGELLHALESIYTPSGSQPPAARPVARGDASRGASAAPVAEASARRVSLALPIALGVVALSVAVVFFVTRKKGDDATTAPAATAATDTSAASGIAVLPFENLGDTSQAYFAAGITDAVRAKLVGLQSIRVIARGSSNQYNGTTKSPAEIARDLGVRYLLTGAVRFAAPGSTGRVQVTPELVEVTAEGQPASRWTEAFDAEVKDVFKVQGDIAGKVAAAMQVALGGAAQAQLAQAPTQDAEAYDAYLRGMAAWNFEANVDPRSLRRAQEFFEQATAHDPKMVEAWSALSRALSLKYTNGSPSPEDARRSREAAERALALEPTSVAGHRAMSAYYSNVASDFPRALEEIETALRVSPRDVALLGSAAGAKDQLGRFEEAVRDRQAALALDPRSGARWTSLAANYLRLRRYDDARAAADRAISLVPTSLNAHQARVMAELGLGRLDSARAVIVRAATDIPVETVAAYIATYWDLGWSLDARSERLLLTLGPDPFDGDKGSWALVRAQQHDWRGEAKETRMWGDTAVRYFREQLRQSPRDQQLHVLLGLSLAYAGNGKAGIAEGEQGIASRPLEKGGSWQSVPYFMYILARIYLLAGEPDKALGELEQILKLPMYVSKAWLRIDPTWKALRGNPRFEALIAGA